MEDRPLHKRSKSARVLNVLRGDATPKDSGSESGSPIAPTSGNLLSLNTTNSPSAPNDAARLSPLTTTFTKTSQFTMEHESPAPAPGDTTADKIPSGVAPGTSSSIDESVRTFRVFEVLRGKDTAAISKAIQDNQPSPSHPAPFTGTTILHLAIQCAEPQVVQQVLSEGKSLDINTQDREGNTALHLAAQLGRAPVVNQLLEDPGINDAIVNKSGKTPIDLARTPEIFGQLQLSKSLFHDRTVKHVQSLVAHNEYKKLEDFLVEPRVEGTLDVNALELPTDRETVQSGGTLLHEAARKREIQLAQLLLLHGADPFRRDRRGKLPQDVTKDDRTKAILRKSPAAAAAQRGIQEKAILGSHPAQGRSGSGADTSKDAREMKGYLKKWTNYTSGYKLRWFVLEDGVLSYYKHQDDAGSACRGAINMRIGKLQMDAQDKSRFEIHGKSSVKYHLKANHVVEAKRWFWSLNNAIQYAKDEAKEDDKRRSQGMESSRSIRAEQVADVASIKSKTGAALGVPMSSSKVSFRSDVDAASAYDSYEPSAMGDELHRMPTNAADTVDGDDEMDGDDASSHEVHHPGSKDAFNITAQSAKLQLDLLAKVSGALNAKKESNPQTSISDSQVTQALSTYDSAVSSLNSLIADLLRISRDRDAYWQYRLDRDADARRMWEESMAQIAYEHEDLRKSMAQSEDKRKRTKRALKEALEGQSLPPSRPGSAQLPPPTEHIQFNIPAEEQIRHEEQIRPEARASVTARNRKMSVSKREGNRRKSVIAQYTNLSDSESGDDEEFFDAIDAGEVEVVESPLFSPPPGPTKTIDEEKGTLWPRR